MSAVERVAAVAARVVRQIVVPQVLVPSMGAAVGVCFFEALHAMASSPNLATAAATTFAILGLTGLPTFLAALVVCTVGAGLAAAWSSSQPKATPIAPERRIALGLFLFVSCAALTLGLQAATLAFTGAFKRPVYQGLAVGLCGTGLALVLLVASSPVIAVLAWPIRALRSRLVRFAPFAMLDPATALGATVLVSATALLATATAPDLKPEWTTLDLRPIQLGVLGLACFGLSRTLLPRRIVHTRRAACICLGFAVLLGGALGYSRDALSRDARLHLALDRDTIATGPLLRRLRTLMDEDGDRVASRWGGGDCDDRRRDLRPGAFDAPDDGRDQNCTGADLHLADDPAAAPQPRRATPPSAPQAPSSLNVVFITLDAVRADLASEHMPNLRALAAEGVDFQRAYSHGAATYWSLPALLASNLPSRIEMGADQTPVEGEVLLPEVLRDAGWYTGLFANVTVFFVRGLRQGSLVANYETSEFTHHGDRPGSEHLTDGLLGFIDARGATLGAGPGVKPFFVWGHYYDPHDPYFEVPGFPAHDGSEEGHYRAILQYTDLHLGRLMDGLRERGLWDRTVVVVTADHGDEFGEHGHRHHGRTLYEEMVHVPLVVRVPGLSAQVISAPIGHVDVAPTLLELIGVPVPSRFRGASWAPHLLTGSKAPVRPVYVEVFPDSNYGSHQVGVIDGDQKLIHRLSEGVFEAYDLKLDPSESNNIFDDGTQRDGLFEDLMRYEDHHLYHLAQGKSGALLPPGAKVKPGARR